MRYSEMQTQWLQSHMYTIV